MPPVGTSLQRVSIAAGVGVAVIGGLLLVTPWQFAVPAGWSSGHGVFLVMVWPYVSRLSPEQVEHWAAQEDDTRTMAGALLLGAAVASIVAVGFALRKAAHTSGPQEAALTAIALVTVVVSWFVVNTVYALRYAHIYYAVPPGGGVEFADGPPDYHDFAYLSFTIGMAYQVSDTGLRSKKFRRTLLRHALLSYLFGAVIIATMINTVAGFVSR